MAYFRIGTGGTSLDIPDNTLHLLFRVSSSSGGTKYHKTYSYTLGTQIFSQSVNTSTAFLANTKNASQLVIGGSTQYLNAITIGYKDGEWSSVITTLKVDVTNYDYIFGTIASGGATGLNMTFN